MVLDFLSDLISSFSFWLTVRILCALLCFIIDAILYVQLESGVCRTVYIIMYLQYWKTNSYSSFGFVRVWINVIWTNEGPLYTKKNLFHLGCTFLNEFMVKGYQVCTDIWAASVVMCECLRLFINLVVALKCLMTRHLLICQGGSGSTGIRCTSKQLINSMW